LNKVLFIIHCNPVSNITFDIRILEINTGCNTSV
jgi:hypothetical protein